MNMYKSMDMNVTMLLGWFEKSPFGNNKGDDEEISHRKRLWKVENDAGCTTTDGDDHYPNYNNRFTGQFYLCSLRLATKI